MSSSAVAAGRPMGRGRRPQAQAVLGGRRKLRPRAGAGFDSALLVAVLVLIGFGLVMVASASAGLADREHGVPFYYLYRQSLHAGAALVVAAVALQVPLSVWERYGGWLFILSVLLLVMLLIPGVGREVNGSVRWISIVGISVQPSELTKLAVVLYLAGYLVRRGPEVRTSAWGFLKPMLLLIIVAALLLFEPDFGAAAIIFAGTMGLMFLGGVRLWQFGLLLLVVALGLVVLALSSPYRLERLQTFMNPWADPFNHGFQLTQALIAFGRGEWLGVGLGGSIQKLFYLPEAHTDFLFAVIAEELGMVGAVAVLALYVFLVWRGFAVGARAAALGMQFAAYLAYGLGLWVALQTFVNLGVNMGLLPTKGLTLPLMSYGGTSMIVMCLAFALLLRVDHEVRQREEKWKQ